MQASHHLEEYSLHVDNRHAGIAQCRSYSDSASRPAYEKATGAPRFATVIDARGHLYEVQE